MPVILALGKWRKMDHKVFFSYTMISRLALATGDPISNKTTPTFQNTGSRNALQHLPTNFSLDPSRSHFVMLLLLLLCCNFLSSLRLLTKLVLLSPGPREAEREEPGMAPSI